MNDCKLFDRQKGNITIKQIKNMNYNFDHESDSETIQQTETIQQPIVTLEYLLNQNKMKEIALGKATHLIELYKIELQVKQQDYLKELELVRQTQKENYQAIITELQQKILDLERELRTQQTKLKEKQRIIKENQNILRDHQHKHLRPKVRLTEQMSSTEKLNDSGCMIPKMVRNNSVRNLVQNRRMSTSQSKAAMHNKNNSSSNCKQQGQYMRRSFSGMISQNEQQHAREQDIYRIEKAFLIDYLLHSAQQDEQIVSQQRDILSFQQQYFSELKSAMRGNDKFMQGFIRVLKQPSLEIQNRLRHYQEVVKIQELIIEELNGQLNEYQNLFHGMNSAILDVFQQQKNGLQLQHENRLFQEFRDAIDDSHGNAYSQIKQLKNFIKQKIQNMETENKELKRILEDMIKLIKNNKKINSIALTNEKLSSFATANESVSSSTNKHERPSSFSQSGNSKISAFGYENEKHHSFNVTNMRVSQDVVSMSRDKISSQLIYRK